MATSTTDMQLGDGSGQVSCETIHIVLQPHTMVISQSYCECGNVELKDGKDDNLAIVRSQFAHAINTYKTFRTLQHVS